MQTDTFFSDAPTHDDGILGHGGATMLQISAGKENSILARYPMHEKVKLLTLLRILCAIMVLPLDCSMIMIDLRHIDRMY